MPCLQDMELAPAVAAVSAVLGYLAVPVVAGPVAPAGRPAAVPAAHNPLLRGTECRSRQALEGSVVAGRENPGWASDSRHTNHHPACKA